MAEKSGTMGSVEELGDSWGEYSEWYNQVLRAVFYPKDVALSELPAPPASFDDWLLSAKKEGTLDSSVLDNLTAIHSDIAEIATRLHSNTRSGEAPKLDDFDELMAIHEDLALRLRRIEQDSELADSGIDSETGFRSMSVFQRDILREIDRRARTNTPFCLAAVKIDMFSHLKTLGEDISKQAIQVAAESIQECLRTFDDAYRKDADEFLFCLKNTDLTGASAAIGRINRALERSEFSFEFEGNAHKLSISSSMCEVHPNENIDELVDNLCKDVKNAANEPGTILQFKELSQLERYAKTMKNN